MELPDPRNRTRSLCVLTRNDEPPSLSYSVSVSLSLSLSHSQRVVLSKLPSHKVESLRNDLSLCFPLLAQSLMGRSHTYRKNTSRQSHTQCMISSTIQDTSSDRSVQ
ncbi:hypothetical protein chiPu_0025972, partial [Chiloscyllium punctatum]|nr:hypothetical protein [Chiloscyllium punctatum]